MNTAPMISNPARFLAAISAVLATVISLGGPLTLADHYAQAAVEAEGSTTQLAQQLDPVRAQRS